mgnify:CR=1 FL=1
MSKKIVVLGNGQEWCECALTDLENSGEGKVINTVLPYNTRSLLYKFALLHFSKKINDIVNLPFKNKWFPLFADYICDDESSELLILIYDWNKFANNKDFLYYLRCKFRNCKLVYVFTNIVNISGANRNNFLNRLHEYYDLINTYDFADAKKYGFNYLPNMYSKIIKSKGSYNNIIFFVGEAKDRLDFIHKVYNRIHELGYSTEFYVVNVSENATIYSEGIVYNKRISYYEVINHVNNSGCILDIIQGESEGFTLKVCEAIYYNKLLITTNSRIKELPFYDERFMIYIEKPEDICADTFRHIGKCQYSEEAIKYFSVKNYIEKTLKELSYE